jgi:hypothetical protein
MRFSRDPKGSRLRPGTTQEYAMTKTWTAALVALSVVGTASAIAQSAPTGATPNSDTRSIVSQPGRTDQGLLPGANSFTQAEARQRIEKNGYADVTDLAKDSQGIWHGVALKDGHRIGVALDYKGNVVAADQAAQMPADSQIAPAPANGRPPNQAPAR